jgi:acetolactate synthase I/III small subunit
MLIMTEQTIPAERSGQSNALPGTARSYTLMVFAREQHGTLDRIVGVLRRRRAKPQTMTVAHSELPGVLRITVVTDDTEVAVEHLIEQLHKVVDVQQVVNLSPEQAIARELALIKVNSSATRYNEIIEQGQIFGAHVIDVAQESVTFEVTGSSEKIEQVVRLLRNYGVCEVARTGYVAIARGNSAQSTTFQTD